MMAPPAAAAPAPPAPPAAPPAKTWKDFLLVEGLVDSYYQYNFTGTTSLTPTTGGRNFDLNSNTFTLNYAKLGLGVNPEPVGLRIDLGYGATGALINGANPGDGSLLTEGFLVQQAYATIAPAATPGLTIDFGKFVTTAGAEVIEANKNWTYSRSLLFFNIPLLHTGLRATFAASKELILQASVVNGWNGIGYAPDVTKDKTYGVSINYTAPFGTNIIATGYFGKGEQYIAAGMPAVSTDTRVVGDLVVAHTLGALALNLNVDYVNDKMAGFNNLIGVAAMGHYTISDNLTFTLRGEFLKNDTFKEYEGTATLGVPVAGHYEFRLELREDHASVETFDVDPVIGAKDKDQFTGTAAFLAWF